MLDVHPPHAPTHSWRDFFIHIATIVVGLLIAVGLEQTVEAIHHRIEVSETRKALHAEFADNLLRFRYNVASTRFVRQEMIDNLDILLYLKQHPQTPQEELPGVLRWRDSVESPLDSAWTTAQQTAVLAYMPRGEVANLALFYAQQRQGIGMEERLWDAINLARRFIYADPDPSHLSPAQLDREIDLTEACIDADFRWTVALQNLAGDDSRFTPAPTDLDRQAFQQRLPNAAELQKLATPQKLTDDREKPYWEALSSAEDAITNHELKSKE